MTASDSAVKAEKKRLRDHYLAKREALLTHEQMGASHHIVESFLSSDIFKTLSESSVIGAYYPAGREISPLLLLEHTIECGMQAALPIIIGHNQSLAFAPWHPDAEMVSGELYAHIAEPEHSPDERCVPDLLLVPLLAIDENGHRLGFGGGYYDRTIAKLQTLNPKLITVGVGYDWQMHEELLPSESHDMTLGYFLSEKRLVRF